jgi:hypothetical protein
MSTTGGTLGRYLFRLRRDSFDRPHDLVADLYVGRRRFAIRELQRLRVGSHLEGQQTTIINHALKRLPIGAGEGGPLDTLKLVSVGNINLCGVGAASGLNVEERVARKLKSFTDSRIPFGSDMFCGLLKGKRFPFKGRGRGEAQDLLAAFMADATGIPFLRPFAACQDRLRHPAGATQQGRTSRCQSRFQGRPQHRAS